MQVSASAKAILFGEHAVVYSSPAIAVPVSDLRCFVSIEPSQNFEMVAQDINQVFFAEDIQTSDHALCYLIRLVLVTYQISLPNIKIVIKSQIPVASGLGSGASVSTAIVRAIFEYLNKAISNEELNNIVYEVEKVHHGTPSGIDNTVIVYEQPIFFIKGQSIEFIQVKKAFYLLIADTGESSSTRTAVSGVRMLFEENPLRVQKVFDEITEIVHEARKLIESGYLQDIGELMYRNHYLLQELGVSSPELDSLVEVAKRYRALGAKLSGAGCGGNIIVLLHEDAIDIIRQALLAAGATQVFVTRVS